MGDITTRDAFYSEGVQGDPPSPWWVVGPTRLLPESEPCIVVTGAAEDDVRIGLHLVGLARRAQRRPLVRALLWLAGKAAGAGTDA